jgi:hypothetical protein
MGGPAAHDDYGIFFPWGTKLAAAAPGGVVAALLDRLPTFFRIMLLPAALGLLAPEVFAVALPFVVGAASVHWPAFPHHDLQHLSPAVVATPWAFTATALRYAPRVLASRRRTLWAGGAVLAVSLGATTRATS